MSKGKHPPYEYMIQEALLSEEGRRSFSRRFISVYILSNYPCLLHDDDHTTLLNLVLQELTQRKVISVIIDVEHRSEDQYTLEERIYYPDTGAERPTTALHLRPANYPRVEAQHPQGGKGGENGTGTKKRMGKTISAWWKRKVRSVREIGRRIDVEKVVVQNVLKNVLEPRVTVVAKEAVAQVARGMDQQIIVEEVQRRLRRMLLEVSVSIVRIAEAEAPASPGVRAAVAAEAAAAAEAPHPLPPPPPPPSPASPVAPASPASPVSPASPADHDQVLPEYTEEAAGHGQVVPEYLEDHQNVDD